MGSEYGELVNLDNLHYAKVTTDTDAAYEAAAVAYLAPAGDISHEAATNIKTRYYDGKPMFTTVTEGATAVSITVSGIPAQKAAELTGKPYDVATGRVYDTGDASKTPWYSFGGRMELGDGGYRYFWYLKGKFSLGAEEAATKTDDIDEKTYSLTYTAMVTIHEFVGLPNPDGGEDITAGVKAVKADTTDPAFDPTGWFDQVQTPDSAGAPTAIALSSIVPAADATAVVKTADIVITFNNKIADSNISLVNSPLGTFVTAITKAWNATGKVLTVHPTTALAGATRHAIIIANVTDIYGQELTDTVKYFTTAS